MEIGNHSLFQNLLSPYLLLTYPPLHAEPAMSSLWVEKEMCIPGEEDL